MSGSIGHGQYDQRFVIMVCRAFKRAPAFGGGWRNGQAISAINSEQGGLSSTRGQVTGNSNGPGSSFNTVGNPAGTGGHGPSLPPFGGGIFNQYQAFTPQQGPLIRMNGNPGMQQQQTYQNRGVKVWENSHPLNSSNMRRF